MDVINIIMKLYELYEEYEWEQDGDRDVVNPLPIIDSAKIFNIMDDVDEVLLQQYKDENNIDGKLPDYRMYGKIIVNMRERVGSIEDVQMDQIVCTEKFLSGEHLDNIKQQSNTHQSSTVPLFYKHQNTYYAADGNHRIVAGYQQGDKIIKGLVLNVANILGQST